MVDIVVGQESKVTEFNIKNTGYGYNVNEILTIPVGGDLQEFPQILNLMNLI